MYTSPRRQKYLKRKLIIYFLLLGVLGGVIFILNSFFLSGKPLFISPMGKASNDITIIEKSLKAKNIPFSKIVVLPSAYLIYIPNNGQVEVSSAKDIVNQISSLQRILIQLTIEGKPFRMINFRFSEPIISF